MRSAGVLAVLLGVLGVTAAVSPGVARLLGDAHEFSRVFNRVFEILGVVGLALVWRRLDLGMPAAIGLGRAGAGRALVRGLVAGLVGLSVGLLLAWAGGALVPALRYPALKTVRKAALGLAGALAIGLGEEVLFRGVLLRRLTRDFGRRAAVAIVTAVYAVVHAIRNPADRIAAGPWAGVERTVALFAPLADATVWPSVAGLAGLGLLLAWLRLRTGTLWWSIGVHAGWVAVFRVGRLFFDLRRTPAWLVGPGWPPLVGGLAGGMAVIVTAVVASRLFGRWPGVVDGIVTTGEPGGDRGLRAGPERAVGDGS